MAVLPQACRPRKDREQPSKRLGRQFDAAAPKTNSKSRRVIPGWSEGSDLRCAIAHRGIPGFRVRCFASPRN